MNLTTEGIECKSIILFFNLLIFNIFSVFSVVKFEILKNKKGLAYEKNRD